MSPIKAFGEYYRPLTTSEAADILQRQLFQLWSEGRDSDDVLLLAQFAREFYIRTLTEEECVNLYSGFYARFTKFINNVKRKVYYVCN